MKGTGCPLSPGARRFAHPEPIGVTPLDMMRILGTLDGAMVKLETFKKNYGKTLENCGELNDLMRKTGNWVPDDAMKHYFFFFWGGGEGL